VQTVKPVPALQVVQAVLCTFDRGFFVARPLQVCTHNAYITHKEKPIRRKAKGDALRKTDWTAPVLCVRTLPLLLLFVHSYLAVAALFVRTLPLLLCLYKSCCCCIAATICTQGPAAVRAAARRPEYDFNQGPIRGLAQS
jgi:hypothetical protein